MERTRLIRLASMEFSSARESKTKEQTTQNELIEMKFDDKLLPSENDLSQNEYKEAFFSSVVVWPLKFYAQIKNIYAIVFGAYCKLMAHDVTHNVIRAIKQFLSAYFTDTFKLSDRI